jgi:hypothetical protein
MAKTQTRTRTIKVDYKKLVREVNKTLKKLKKIEPNVEGKGRREIELQIKALDYLAEVCEASAIKPANPPLKMSGCAAVIMSRTYVVK